MSEAHPRLYLDADQVSEMTGLSVPTVRRAAARGELKSYTVGRRRLFRPDDVTAWVECR